MTTMTPPETNNAFGSKAELFADSFDSWIEADKQKSLGVDAMVNENAAGQPAPLFEQASGGQMKSANLSGNSTMKWSAWAEDETLHNWPTEAVEVFDAPTTARPREVLLRRVAYFVTGLTAFLLMSLLCLSLTNWKRKTVVISTSPVISTQKRALWQNVVQQNAFKEARTQARLQKRSLSIHEKQGAAKKAVLETINTAGPDYVNFAAAKKAGAVNSNLWTLAWSGAIRGGELPRAVARRTPIYTTTRHALTRRVRVARAVRRSVPQKQAVILGRGPVRENTNSIILIRD